MTRTINSAEDLRWFLAHTHGFRDGHITDVHVSKRRIFDERSGHEVLAGSTATVVVQYSVQDGRRIARLIMQGVSDLCIFEQDGADCSLLGTIQVELNDGRLRFWFDPEGKLYVVCEEALLEEFVLPQDETNREGVGQWTFQGGSGEAPSLHWLLDQLDQAGLPCTWKGSDGGTCGLLCLEGQLVATNDNYIGLAATVDIQMYRPIGETGFRMQVRLVHRGNRAEGRMLNLVADIVTRSFPGACLAEEAIPPP
ncbi:MAG TPA: hypothetical protein VM842_09600 [Nitrospira sp.]|jgi:hypothetical protein|nr:hypothetical protein [Nitrospira sp.]